MKGSVKFFNKGWGYITVDDESEDAPDTVFVHHTDLVQDGFRKLRRGQNVEFDIATDDVDRIKAVRVKRLSTSDSALQ
jgi:CspA family cold shock protein